MRNKNTFSQEKKIFSSIFTTQQKKKCLAEKVVRIFGLEIQSLFILHTLVTHFPSNAVLELLGMVLTGPMAKDLFHTRSMNLVVDATQNQLRHKRQLFRAVLLLREIVAEAQSSLKEVPIALCQSFGETKRADFLRHIAVGSLVDRTVSPDRQQSLENMRAIRLRTMMGK
jgi:hypothetical protein